MACAQTTTRPAESATLEAWNPGFTQASCGSRRASRLSRTCPVRKSSASASTHLTDADRDVRELRSWHLVLRRLGRKPTADHPDVERERAGEPVAVDLAHRDPVDRVDTRDVGRERDPDLLTAVDHRPSSSWPLGIDHGALTTAAGLRRLGELQDHDAGRRARDARSPPATTTPAEHGPMPRSVSPARRARRSGPRWRGGLPVSRSHDGAAHRGHRRGASRPFAS